MRLFRSCYALVLVPCLWALQPSTTAQASSAPQDVLRALADSVLTILTDEELKDADRQQAFRALLQRSFDVDRVSRFVLGRYWRSASEQERQAFQTLFEDYIVATYSVRLGRLDAKVFHVTGTRPLDGPDHVLVQSEIRPPNSPTLQVDWRMQQIDERWLITDIVVEGVSMAVAQRAEFASVIRNDGGVDGLIARLEAKTRHLDNRRYANKQ